MLIDKQTIFEFGDVVTLKLLSGEEIIGRFVEQTGSHIAVAKPVALTMQPISATQMGMAFAPVLGSVEPDTSLQIPLTALALIPLRTGSSVKSNYIETTSGLITAKNGLLAG